MPYPIIYCYPVFYILNGFLALYFKEKSRSPDEVRTFKTVHPFSNWRDCS